MTDDIRHTLCHKSGQTKVERWPNKVDWRAESGLCKVYNPKRWPAEGAVLFRPIMWLYSASVVLVWDSFLPFTLLCPYSSKVHLVLATALFFFFFAGTRRSLVPHTKTKTIFSTLKPRLVQHTHPHTDGFFFWDVPLVGIRNSLRSNNCCTFVDGNDGSPKRQISRKSQKKHPATKKDPIR